MTEEERKERQRAAKRAWYEAHREYFRAYREANREKITEYRKAYRAANREKIAEQRRASYQAKREYYLAWQKAYYEKKMEERKKEQPGKKVRPKCDRDCLHCPYPDCVQENMSLEELRSSNERDREIRLQRDLEGDPPERPTKEARRVNAVEYKRAWRRAAWATQSAEKRKEKE